MKRAICAAPTPALLVLLALALAGCNDTPTAPSAAVGASGGRVATHAPGGPNAAAETICVKAVQQQTNAEGVAILGSEAAAGETVVMVGYPKATAPWRCVVAPDGRVTEVTNTGTAARS